ncbi:MAG: Gfo/Idh/MocA family oxidoreductase [Pirellulaceae bacterium]|nr:Gfo/Idh/MocA family oxidoreductase [Pirellulaceae bacterium]
MQRFVFVRWATMCVLFVTVQHGFCNKQVSAQQSSRETSEPLRVAVITDRDGSHLSTYFSIIHKNSSISDVAVASPSQHTVEMAKQRFGERPFQHFTETEEMLTKFRPRFVVVSLASHLAPAQIRAALEAGCDVVAEKPGCTSVEDFRELVQLADEKQRNLMLALPLRFRADTKRLKELIDRGYVGKLYGITGNLVDDQVRLTRPGWQRSWHGSRRLAGGGHLTWLGIHKIDQFLFLTQDRVRRVAGFYSNVGGQPIDIEDTESVALDFHSGFTGTFQGGFYLGPGGSVEGLRIWGDTGWIEQEVDFGAKEIIFRLRWLSTHPDAPEGVQTEELPRGESVYQQMFDQAIDAARGAADPPLRNDESLHILEVIFGAYRAAETGKVQTLQ